MSKRPKCKLTYQQTNGNFKLLLPTKQAISTINNEKNNEKNKKNLLIFTNSEKLPIFAR